MMEAEGNGASKAVLTGVLDRLAFRDLRLDLLKDAPGAISAAVIDDHNFMWNPFQP
jgi:hypothetical protein